jgi:hypothetical protein
MRTELLKVHCPSDLSFLCINVLVGTFEGLVSVSTLQLDELHQVVKELIT